MDSVLAIIPFPLLKMNSFTNKGATIKSFTQFIEISLYQILALPNTPTVPPRSLHLEIAYNDLLTDTSYHFLCRSRTFQFTMYANNRFTSLRFSAVHP